MSNVEVKTEPDLAEAGDAENSQIHEIKNKMKLEERGLVQRYMGHICIKEEQEEQEVCIKKEEDQLQECPFMRVSVKSEETENSSAMIHQKSSLECTSEISAENSGGSNSDHSSNSQTLRHLQSVSVKETDSDTDDSEDWNKKPAKSSTGPEVDSRLDPYRHSDTDSDNSWEWEPPVRSAKKTEKSMNEEHNLVNNNKATNKIKVKTKQHQCLVCKKAFVDNTGLKKHELIHTGRRPFSCLVCKKDFIRKCHLKSHLITHTNERPFSCSECGKAFKQKQGLRDHKVVHSQERPFFCTVCKTGFKQKGAFRSHMLIHSEDKHLKCSICEKVFTQKKILNIHMTVHSGEKPFCCSFCIKQFSRKKSLNRHMLIHTGEKPLSCTVCKKCYRHQSFIQKHMKSHIRQLKNTTV